MQNSNQMNITTTNYFDQLINAIKINYTEDEVNRIPITGSLVALSNRPIGLIEELIIYKIMKKRRNDFFFFKPRSQPLPQWGKG